MSPPNALAIITFQDGVIKSLDDKGWQIKTGTGEMVVLIRTNENTEQSETRRRYNFDTTVEPS
jgi:hypothetical protein